MEKNISFVNDKTCREGTICVYLLVCGDGSLYCGWTNHLQKRVAAHQSGKGGKYTRSHLPVRLAYYETAVSREAALRREAAIKKLSRKKKLELIEQARHMQGSNHVRYSLLPPAVPLHRQSD